MADEPNDGSWDQWRRLVLADLRRLGTDVRDLSVEVRTLAKTTEVSALEKRLLAVETQLDAAEDRIGTYRKTIIAVTLTLFASIGFPIVRAWLTTKGG